MPGPANVNAYKLIRSFWPQKAINEMFLRRDKFLGLVRKDTGFVEKKRYIGVGTGEPQGLASGFAKAKANKSASKAVEFEIEPNQYFGTFSIDGQLFRKVKAGGSKALIVDPIKRDSKNLVEAAQRDFSWYIHGNGGGLRGVVSAISGTELTLTVGRDYRRFGKDMIVQVSDGGQPVKDGTAGTILRGGTAMIAKITGVGTTRKLVATQSWASAIPGIAVGDGLFRDGTAGSVLSGFGAWLPAHDGTTPPSDFKGVVRADLPEGLAGVWMPNQGLNIRQSILELARQVYDNGGEPDLGCLSTTNYSTLANELESAGKLIMTKATAQPIGKVSTGIEHDAIQVMGPAGPIKIIALAEMPDTVGRLLSLDTWTLASTGELLHWDDGSTPDDMRVEDGTDSREARLVSDSELYCDAPGWNGSFEIAQAS